MWQYHLLSPASILHFILVTVIHTTILVGAEVTQCHIDCQASSPLLRPVGPTRPWHTRDLLGNDLDLTRPYPYNIAGSTADVIPLNISYMYEYAESNLDVDTNYSFTLSMINRRERKVAFDALHAAINMTWYPLEWDVNFINDDEIVLNQSSMNQTEASTKSIQIDFQVFLFLGDDENENATTSSAYSHSPNNISLALSSALTDTELRLNTNDTLVGGVEESNSDENVTINNRTFTISPAMNISSDSTSNHSFKMLRINEELPTTKTATLNPYSEFCNVGCSIFYASPSDPLHVSECTNVCDDLYRYNISVGYNDLAEVARLECRDGCQMALMRCKPGYYCTQVQLIDANMEDEEGDGRGDNYHGGFMAHCPAGTYRDVSYDKVEECIPCPPGEFREDIKGRNADGCSKCPVGTYNVNYGGSTIDDCLRCPAGTFTNEPGSEHCICITPAACDSHQLPFPADAEKRDSVPYIGRW